MKNSFITNLNLYRFGQKLKLREHIRSKDPDPRKYDPPYSINSIDSEEFLSCTGKNIADGVESLLGAIFLSNNLYRTLLFISDIQLVPLEQAKLMKHFPNCDITFKLDEDLDKYQFDLMDSVQNIFQKYFDQEPEVPVEQVERINKLIDPQIKVRDLGQAFTDYFQG